MLAWCQRRPEIASVIVGATRTERVDDNVPAADLAVDASLFARMAEILEPVAPFEPYVAYSVR